LGVPRILGIAENNLDFPRIVSTAEDTLVFPSIVSTAEDTLVFPSILSTVGDNLVFPSYPIVACSRKQEYLNQSDRPLLDNGHDKTKYAAVSR
jgi:hypothetical protein